MDRQRRYGTALGGLLLLQLLGGCAQPDSQAGLMLEADQLDQVLQSGKLVVVTRNTATTYYEGPDGPTGMEYDLARGFADQLGVELELVVAHNLAEVLQLLAQGSVHFAAAGITITDSRQGWLRFTPPYQEINQQLVYRQGTPRPATVGELAGRLEVIAASAHIEMLSRLKREHPYLAWKENDLDSEDLLSRLYKGAIDYTVADSHEVALNQRFMPELRIAFELGAPEQLAWAFPRHHDDSLHRAATAYFEQLGNSGRLAQLLEKHYGHVNKFDYVGTRTYLRHIEQRLPEFRRQFELAGANTELDWRLLAAMGYQESHWDPAAVSPTGVRGLMMLTKVTARELGVEQRADPEQSIDGGARYFRSLLDRLPVRIQGRDRYWLALAAYNIGPGHLEDARVLTQQRGGDPDKWMDVKENLPLLHQRQWYEQTRYGYARGNEAVRYVENIRSYHDILAWILERHKPVRETPRVTTTVSYLTSAF